MLHFIFYHYILYYKSAMQLQNVLNWYVFRCQNALSHSLFKLLWCNKLSISLNASPSPCIQTNMPPIRALLSNLLQTIWLCFVSIILNFILIYFSFGSQTSDAKFCKLFYFSLNSYGFSPIFGSFVYTKLQKKKWRHKTTTTTTTMNYNHIISTLRNERFQI